MNRQLCDKYFTGFAVKVEVSVEAEALKGAEV